MRVKTLTILPILGILLFFAAPTPVRADTPYYICQAVMRLASEGRFLRQTDDVLKKAGLFSKGGRSKLCGVGCAVFVDQTIFEVMSGMRGLDVPGIGDVNEYGGFTDAFDGPNPKPKDKVRETGVAPATLARGLRKRLAQLGGQVKVRTMGVEQWDLANPRQNLDIIVPKLTIQDLIGPPGVVRLSILAMYQYNEKAEITWGHWLYAYYFDPVQNLMYMVDPNGPNRILPARVMYQPLQGKQLLRLDFPSGVSPTIPNAPKNSALLVRNIVTVDFNADWQRSIGR